MTAQEIINAAAERSNLNDKDLISTTELLDYITLYERRVYLTAARENPDFFGREGNTSARASSTDSWSLTSAPGNIAAVSKIEVQSITGSVSGISAGDDVNIISIRDPDAALAPRVYIRNKTVREYNQELQDDSSNYVTRLKVYYSFLPPDRTSTSDSLALPGEFNNLVILPVAALMAIRDQRPEEAQVLQSEFQLDWSTFLQHLGVFDEGVIRELSQVQASAPELREGG